MEFFVEIMKLCISFLQKPFTLYGYTFSFMNIIYLVLFAGLVVAIFSPIFKD